ncbi:MAG: hypothetical protein JWN44_1335 [Myxococcales bacterium]|nr:hypothetical protein [Myxococcales bacterium]
MTGREMARLVHDVGKYVARTARNLPAAPTPEMIDMLVRDLYELRPGRRASSLFDELAPPEPSLAGVRALLSEVDRLEPSVRAREAAAVGQAAELAREIERQLRALLSGA